jgi:hypothetical protein
MFAHGSCLWCPPAWCDSILLTALVVHNAAVTLQIMLDRARAAPGTNISGIFTSGALDKLAAALQAVLPFTTATQWLSALHFNQNVAQHDICCWCMWSHWLQMFQWDG